MSLLSTFLIAFGLSMDSFAVSITKGVIIKKDKLRNSLKLALTVFVFHVLMTFAGWFAGSSLGGFVSGFDHWIAFGLLTLVGGRILYEAWVENETDELEDKPSLSNKILLMLAVATSIDALAVGGSFAFLKNVNILSSSLIIGIIAGLMSFVGFSLGRKFGSLLGKKAEVVGGIVLVAIGVKTLLEHLL